MLIPAPGEELRLDGRWDSGDSGDSGAIGAIGAGFRCRDSGAIHLLCLV